MQVIAESVNVLRMIKLFGWEEKMTDRLEEKREEELTWLWKVQVREKLLWASHQLIGLASSSNCSTVSSGKSHSSVANVASY